MNGGNNDDNYNHNHQMIKRNPTFVQNISNWKMLELQTQAKRAPYCLGHDSVRRTSARGTLYYPSSS